MWTHLEEVNDWTCPACGALMPFRVGQKHLDKCKGGTQKPSWAADEERRQAALNREKGDYNLKGALAFFEGIVGHPQGYKSAVERLTYNLKKDSNRTALDAWGIMQTALGEFGKAFTGKAGKRNGFNDFCEKMAGQK